MLTKETNEEGVSPTRFFLEDEQEFSQPHYLSYWSDFIVGLATGEGCFTTTTANMQTLPTMTHEERAGITINVHFLINNLSFETLCPIQRLS